MFKKFRVLSRLALLVGALSVAFASAAADDKVVTAAADQGCPIKNSSPRLAADFHYPSRLSCALP